MMVRWIYKWKDSSYVEADGHFRNFTNAHALETDH